MSMKAFQKKEKHIHTFTQRTLKVNIYNSVVYPSGKVELGIIVGNDLLKQHICKCGLVTTYDLERIKLGV